MLKDRDRGGEAVNVRAFRELAGVGHSAGLLRDAYDKYVPTLCDWVTDLRLALDVERGMADDKLPPGWVRDDPDGPDVVVIYRRSTPSGGCAFAWTKHRNRTVTSGFTIWTTPEPYGTPMKIDGMLSNCLVSMQECDAELYRR